MQISKSPCAHCQKLVRETASLSHRKHVYHFCIDCYAKWYAKRDELVDEALEKFIK